MLAILFNPQDEMHRAPKVLFGYSCFTVLTGSMQDEIPKDSFIIVHKTDPSYLQIGDNITFTKGTGTYVTHKIVDIRENYENSRIRGFQTKGTNNLNPDDDIVFGRDIVGKVVFVLPWVGTAISYLSTHLYVVLIVFVLFMIMSFSLRGLFKKRESFC